MNIPKQIKTRSVVVLLACMLVVSSVSIYYAFSASTPTSGITDMYYEPPYQESSYVIGMYTAPSTCYLQNGTTGEIVTTGTFSSVLQAAIYPGMNTGGKVFIRAGRYNLTIPVGIFQSGVYIEGEGLGGVGEPAVQIDVPSSCLTAIYFDSAGDNHYLGGIKNIMFRGSQTTGQIGVIVAKFWSDIEFEHCGFMDFDIGAKLQGTYGVGTPKIWNIWFDGCLFEDNLRYGIYLTDTSDPYTKMIDRVRITNSHFYNNQNSLFCDTQFVYHVTFTDNTVQAERQACINVTSGGRQWIITDNQIFDCGIGANGTMAAIMVNGTGTFYADSWLIENNVIANHFTSAPLAMNNSVWLTGTVRNFGIQNNFFYSAGDAIRLSGLSYTINPLLVIKDNVGNFTGPGGSGDCPVSTTGTYTLTSDTSEHTIVTLTPTSIEQVMNFWIDLSTLTQNCTLKVYYTIGGSFKVVTSMVVTVGSGTGILVLQDHTIDQPWKLTIQSTVAEGSSRSIPYEYFVNVY